MDFTIILNRETPFGTRYHANFDELNTTFGTIVDIFTQLAKKKFDQNKC